MSPEVAAVLVAAVAGSTVAYREWLRHKVAESAPLVASLVARIERLEVSDRNRPQGIAPMHMPHRMSAL